MTLDILNNLIMLVAYLILGYTLYKSDKNGILFGSIAFNVLMAYYFFAVGSLVATISCIVAIIRSYYFKRNERKQIKNTLASLIFFSAVVVVFVTLTYEDFASLFIGVLSLTGTFIFWFNGTEKLDSATVIKFGSPIISLSFILYAFFIGSWLMIPLESILLLGGTFGGFKWIKKDNLNQE